MIEKLRKFVSLHREIGIADYVGCGEFVEEQKAEADKIKEDLLGSYREEDITELASIAEDIGERSLLFGAYHIEDEAEEVIRDFLFV